MSMENRWQPCKPCGEKDGRSACYVCGREWGRKTVTKFVEKNVSTGTDEPTLVTENFECLCGNELHIPKEKGNEVALL